MFQFPQQYSLFNIEDLPPNGIRSPLNFAGSKKLAIPFILPHIPKDEMVFCCPFAGGASIELALVTRNQETTVHASDNFHPLANFWTHLLECPDRLIERADHFFHVWTKMLTRYSHAERMSLGFQELIKQYWLLSDDLSRAALYFVINKRGCMGLAFCATQSRRRDSTEEYCLSLLREFRSPRRFTYEHLEYEESIEKYQDCFLYLDPPYIGKESYYGTRKSTFDHDKLASLLRTRERWLLSYNDHPKVRRLYEGYKTIRIEPKVNMRYKYRDTYHELLIMPY